MYFSTVLTVFAAALLSQVSAAPTINERSAMPESTEVVTPATVAAGALQKRVPGGVFFCQAIGWGAPCLHQVLPAPGCYNMNSPWSTTLSSIGPDENTWCILYDGTNCGGTRATGAIGYPGTDLTGTYAFWNDNVKSINCWW